MNKNIKAIKFFNMAIEMNPQDYAAYLDKGLTYYNMKNYSEANKCYEKCLEINPNDGSVYNSKGLIYLKLKRFKNALDSFDRAIQLGNHEAQHNKTIVSKEKSFYFEKLMINFIVNLILVLLSFMLCFWSVISKHTINVILVTFFLRFCLFFSSNFFSIINFY